MNETQSNELLEIQRQQLEMQKEQRKFTILKRERDIEGERRNRTRSSIAAAICILGAVVAAHFSGANFSDIVQHELGAIYSWESLGQYIQDLGPLVTLLSASAGGFVVKAFRHNGKFKCAKQEFEAMNASLQSGGKAMEVE